LRASLAAFGRRNERSACHCAVVARYSSPPQRVAALRRSSREIVEGARPSFAGNGANSMLLNPQDGDLFALGKRQITAR
jgi:hypothetical protein